MADDFKNFEKRLSRIDRAHNRVSDGYRTTVGPDGLIAVRARRRLPQVPLKGLAYLFLGFCVFKSVAVAHFGMTGYQERVETLRSGTVIEQAGAWALQLDALTVWIASKVDPFIN
ncbi:hypothetical protein [Marimonas lutisalis]|uniref:hypothetical protein n=1 Tax=Marimonas lutisalis TaxID=2545756 RepID=UPI0010F46398|nr:hypothetical protein [Marimonas lutisalis]